MKFADPDATVCAYCLHEVNKEDWIHVEYAGGPLPFSSTFTVADLMSRIAAGDDPERAPAQRLTINGQDRGWFAITMVNGTLVCEQHAVLIMRAATRMTRGWTPSQIAAELALGDRDRG